MDWPSRRGCCVLETGLSPKLLRGEAGAFGEAAQFGPGEVGMDPAAEAAIGAGDDVLAADDLGIAQDAVGDELRVLDEVGGVADHTRHQHLARRQFRLLPYPPLVLVPHIGSLERLSLRLHVEDQIDDVLERQIMGVRPVPARFTALLLGLGLRNLSMAPRNIPRVKQRIRSLDMVAATRRARAIMDQSDTGRIAALLDDFNTVALPQ